MSKHTPPPRPPIPKQKRRSLPRGRAKLVALKVARIVAFQTRTISFPRGTGDLRDHLVRSASNTKLRLSEASGQTGGLRRYHLRAAYAENQEVQGDLEMLCDLGIELPEGLVQQADRLGGLIFGLLRAENAND
jgi:hypothetical protein